MRPVAARGAQVVAAEVELGRGEQLLGAVVVEGGPLELEEQELRLDLRRALLHELQQGAALGVGGRGREVEHRVGARAADELVERGELAHRGGEPGAVERGDLAGVLLGEGVGAALRVGEQCLHPRGAVAGAVEQRIQIPGDPVELGIGDVRCGHAAKDYDARSPSSMSWM